MRIHFILHVPYESPGSLLDWVREKKADAIVSTTRLYQQEELPAIEEVDFVVVMGGPMSVHDVDRFAWLRSEKDFIRRIILADKKILGICLGSQLLAEALGAEVFPNLHKEIGWFPVYKERQTGEGQFSPLPTMFTAFHWHGDTFSLPNGATLLCHSEACRHQAFAVGNRILGIQFHPEATPSLVKNMVENGGDELVAAPWIQDAATICREKRYYEQSRAWFWMMLDQFAGIGE